MSSNHWDTQVGRVEAKSLKGWLDWEFIAENYTRPQTTGDPKGLFFAYYIQRYMPTTPVEKALSLGCGGGNLERALIRRNLAQSVDGFDASEESIRLAQQLAQEQGMQTRLNYAVRDINTIELPPKTYDFVIVKMALHHFEQLEHVYAQIAQSLKEGGVLIFNEFIGPSRYQWTDRQLELMNELLETLPQKNRWSNWTNDYLQTITRPSISEMLSMDPSEAVRSAEIMPRLRDYFEVLDYKPYGGTLLHILLNHVMPTFDLSNPDQEAILRLLFLFERTLVQHGVIESDFACAAARPLPNISR